MKTIKLSIAILFLALCAAIFLKTESPDDSENLFTSGLYRDYLQAWHRPLTADTREDHEAYIKALRKDPVPAKIHTLFLAKDLNPSWKRYFSSLTETRVNAPVQLIALQQEFKDDERFTSLQHPADFEDQMLSGNLPSWVADYQGTSIIRLGQPVLGNTGWLAWISPAEVSPEFQEFIKGRNSHLYVNLMKRHGNEGIFTQKIEALEKAFPQLIVVTIDKNSPFYDQEGWLHEDKETFKTQFLAHLQSPDFYWSSHLDSQWNETLKLAIQTTDDRYFSKESSLSPPKRRDFIELTYLAILDALQAQFHPETMNITCRQGIDRGPSLMGLWLYHHGILNLEQVTVQLFVPPLLFHNRAPHASRIERFVSAIQYP